MISKENTHTARADDPTIEPLGFHRVQPATRNLLVRRDTTSNPFFRGATAKRCKAVTDCHVTRADGTSYVIPMRTPRKRKTRVEVAASVTIRHRPLRAPIAEYLMRAESLGLDLATVRKLYEHRSNNGYQYDRTVSTNETYGFRGSEV